MPIKCLPSVYKNGKHAYPALRSQLSTPVEALALKVKVERLRLQLIEMHWKCVRPVTATETATLHSAKTTEIGHWKGDRAFFCISVLQSHLIFHLPTFPIHNKKFLRKLRFFCKYILELLNLCKKGIFFKCNNKLIWQLLQLRVKCQAVQTPASWHLPVSVPENHNLITPVRSPNSRKLYFAYRQYVDCPYLLHNKSKHIEKVTLANLHVVMYDVDLISPAFYYHFHRLHVDFVRLFVCLTAVLSVQHTFPWRAERQFVFAFGAPIIIIHRECSLIRIRVWAASSKC